MNALRYALPVLPVACIAIAVVVLDGCALPRRAWACASSRSA